MARKTITAQDCATTAPKKKFACPACKREHWQRIEATRYDMTAQGNFAVSVGKCKYCGLGFIDVRIMTPAEIAAEQKRLAAEAAEREAAARARAEAERAEAERREREIARIILERKQARQKAKRN